MRFLAIFRRWRKRWQPMILLVLFVCLTAAAWGVEHATEVSITLVGEMMLHYTLRFFEDT